MSPTSPRPFALHLMEASWGNGEAHVYQCVPSMPVHDYVAEDHHDVADCTGEYPCSSTRYIWVSAANTFSGPETYIFACDHEGRVTDWGELPGSLRGVLDHEAALAGAGYVVSHMSTDEQ